MKVPRRAPWRSVGGGGLAAVLTMSLALLCAETPVRGTAVVQSATQEETEAILAAWPRGDRAYARCEASVRLPLLTGNPFEAAIWGDVDLPGNEVVRIPAFYDGDRIWKIRFTPTRPGSHWVTGFFIGEDRATAQPIAFEPLSSLRFDVDGRPTRGFVKRSPHDTQRFLFDDGTPYLPFGQNLGWMRNDLYPACFERLAEAGLSWSRVWMTHFTGQNLDWHSTDPAASGTLDLEAARRWDRIVEAAEATDIRIQVVLQHHGQFSTFVNPNWNENPWNVANGGFLKRPEDFFIDETARALTRRKYRYIAARWGYSPAILSWELFNEVEFTDGYLGRDLVEVWQTYQKAGRVDVAVLRKASVALVKLAAMDDTTTFGLEHIQSALTSIEKGVFPGFDIGFGVHLVAAWHREMAAHLRDVDPYRRLVTTSSVPVTSPVWDSMDYYQFHAYRDNMIEAVSRLPRDVRSLDRPAFYGEIGDHQIHDPAKADGRYMRTMLWASLFSGAAGPAEMWAWDVVERLDFYGTYRAARRFLDAGGFATRRFLPVDVAFKTISADLGDPAPRVLAARDGGVYALWIYQDRAVHMDNPPVFRGQVVLPSGPKGRLRIEWWDTRKGEIIKSEETETTPEAATIATPPIHGDLAALVFPVDHHEATQSPTGR